MTENEIYWQIRELIRNGDHNSIRNIKDHYPSEKIRRSVTNDFDGGTIKWPLVSFALICKDYFSLCNDLQERDQMALSLVRELVNLGADLNPRSMVERNSNEDDYVIKCVPLNFAISRGFISTAGFLLNKGATSDLGLSYFNPLGTISTHLCAAIHEAVLTSNQVLVKLLLDYGASLQDWYEYSMHLVGNGIPDKSSSINCTPLGTAVLKGDMNMVNFLIEQGAGVDSIQDREGHNILHLPFKYKIIKDEAIDLLLEKGANPNKPNKYGWTPINLATIRGTEENLKKLLYYADLLKYDESPMDIGKRLLEYTFKNSLIPNDNHLDITHYFYDLFSRGHYNLLNMLLSDNFINIIHKGDEGGEIRALVLNWLEEKNYEIVMYFMEKKLFNFLQPIETEIDVVGYNEEKIKEFLQLLDISYVHNPVANLCSMLELLVAIIEDNTLADESFPLLLSRLTTYIPALNDKLLVDLDLMKKEVRHEKLSESLKFFPKIHKKFVELKDTQIQQLEIRDNILDVKGKLEEGVKMTYKVYNPSYFCAFFMRNEDRYFLEDQQDNINNDQKANTASPIHNILSFLDFSGAANFCQALGRKPSDFLDKGDIEERCKKLKFTDSPTAMQEANENDMRYNSYYNETEVYWDEVNYTSRFINLMEESSSCDFDL